jgi:N4-(beta-N-acetylglucosaminyl)-L-asparaginase
MKAIASHNGLNAAARAYELMQQGRSPLDACVESVKLVEDDPLEHSVGYSGIPNEDGIVELDAAVMDGRNRRGAGVAGLRNVRYPTHVAKLLMEQTGRVLVVGAGALAFARANGFVEENLLTEKARRIWLQWKRTHSDTDDWRPSSGPIDPDVQAWFAEHFRPAYRQPAEAQLTLAEQASSVAEVPADAVGNAIRGAPGTTNGPAVPQPPSAGEDRIQKVIDQGGTVHIAALDSARNVACVTSTSGHPFKISGRVGDSPILGAGLYADNAAGTCGSIGHGEANLQNLSSFLTVEFMRSGAATSAGLGPEQAGLEVLRRIAANVPRAEQDASGRPRWNVTLFILTPDGQSAGVSLWGPREYAVADSQGARLLPCKSLWN